MIEPINTYDIAGFFLCRTAQAVAVLDEVGAPNALVQYDLYHAQRMEGELAATLEKYLPRIGYSGWVGCEYKPKTSTQAGLGWRAAMGIPEAVNSTTEL